MLYKLVFTYFPSTPNPAEFSHYRRPQAAKYLNPTRPPSPLDWAAINLSDALRLGVVCSVGGTYLDLDMWTVAPLPANDVWIGRERWDQLSNGAFR